jgi:hypothetical protein
MVMNLAIRISSLAAGLIAPAIEGSQNESPAARVSRGSVGDGGGGESSLAVHALLRPFIRAGKISADLHGCCRFAGRRRTRS